MTNQVEWKATQKLSVKESYQGTAGMASDWLPVPTDSPEGSSDWLFRLINIRIVSGIGASDGSSQCITMWNDESMSHFNIQ